MPSLRSFCYTVGILGIATTVVGCSKTLEDDSGAKCSSRIENYSSPATGVLTLSGSFYSNETILVRDANGALLGSATPPDSRGSLSFINIPSGTHKLTIIASCSDGQRQIDQGDYTIK